MGFKRVGILFVITLGISVFYQTSALPVADHSEADENKNDTALIRPVFRIHNNNYEPPTFTILTSENMPNTWPYYEDLNQISGHCVTGT